ncbi:polyprenyl synthetase family protein [Synoicihabitans lomoniglobus]|uniref:Polyprenyl synthetase family protein n=1 Tax=Synoicihabitans lomoniglobus TaxID=2909285 RepID=A0AAF0CQG4_9BACT|nr:polyprenyl synthetase family protein [Opitutaceae bacterium LMO-M01]WED66190.1 polyprenyl synthetase family protein [Opitutaceae bacterium LMO-M01]
MEVTNKLNSLVARIEAGLDQHVPAAATPPAQLHAAMRYSLEAGGKRLRPALVLAAAETGGVTDDDALPAAVAVECLHTYSLIHDDLPCIDNDDLRRGRPTVHKAYDEATALLAGDALLTHAFALLAEAYADRPALAHALIRELAETAGSRRLIGGQMADLLGEAKGDATAADLEFIHLNKTAAMIETSLVLGGHVAGMTSAQVETLRRAGRHLGLAFQIVDDVLDETSDTATMGKTVGKDAATEKTTYVRLFGLEASRGFITEQTNVAVTALASLPGNTEFLQTLARSMAARAN